MSVRLGEVLVARGLLTEEQRARILDVQASSGRPFGVLAEQMFGVSPRDVEQAWAEQFARGAERIDASATVPAPDALASIERRQAWQFRVLPLRFEHGELVIATDACSLPRAMRFTGWRVGSACRFVIAEPDVLSTALQTFYPMPGFQPAELQALLKQASN